MDANFFKDAAMHQGHDTAAAVATAVVGTFPWGALKASGWLVREGPVGLSDFVFQLFKGVADVVAQLAKPNGCFLFFLSSRSAGRVFCVSLIVPP